MSVILKEKVDASIAWRGIDLQNRDTWLTWLTPTILEAFDQALQGVKAKGLSAPNFGKADFVLPPVVVEEIDALFSDELENGRGFLLVRGLDASQYTEEELTIIYYGLGLHMGTPVTQNEKGDLLGAVQAVGDPSKKSTRVYETNEYLDYHTDLSDVVGLLSIRKAKKGGLSSVVSIAALYNEILEKHPEYLALLYRPIYFDHLGDELPTLSPIFSHYDGKLTCRYLRKYIEIGQERRELPLSNVEREMLDLIDSIIGNQDVHLDMMLEPGDMQFANNYAVFHSRTGFEDYDEPERRRKLLRLWLKMPNARKLAPDFPGRNGIPKRDKLPSY
ncbi:hypothetical protein AGMMS49543_12280 [Betaproteobacteria bacterium]|nr:hypothetical protein AGMMS49543_12280 [Betaproteobacteria bacterium]GHU06644.1 hypothetical protein AGMMS50225_02170 [Betaproteobacteria bacterium]GHU20893.1 hypothetical protein AGMMS50243_17120 [Betaproteobacteria bacterium]